MNCPRCNAPLEAQARFCRNCGLSLSGVGSTPQNVQASQPPIRFPSSSQQAPDEATRTQWQQQQPQQPNVSQGRPAPMPNFYQRDIPGTAGAGVSMPRTVDEGRNVPPPSGQRSRRPGRRLAGCLSVLVLVVLIVGISWFFVLRPILHDKAQTQIDQIMNTAVDHIPAQANQLPSGPLPIQENVVNNLLVLNADPSAPVQKTVVHITPSNVRFDFQAFGQSCAITGVPAVKDGKLIATDVKVEGIAALIMSDDEVTALLNKHLEDALKRINHSVERVVLGDHVMNVFLVTGSTTPLPGSGTPLPGSGTPLPTVTLPVTPPTLP